jgi:hypothetical protein
LIRRRPAAESQAYETEQAMLGTFFIYTDKWSVHVPLDIRDFKVPAITQVWHLRVKMARRKKTREL